MLENEISKTYKPDYWEAIERRLHEESGLHSPLNGIGQLFNTFFNEMLHKFSDDNISFLDQGFLVTAEGLYLDLFGEEMAMPRYKGKFAKGNIIFQLVNRIPKTEKPKKLPKSDEPVTFDYSYESVQQILDSINEERLKEPEYTDLVEPRNAESDVPIFKGTRLFSDKGFEYVTMYDVTIPEGSSTTTVPITAVKSGSMYNVDNKKEITVVDKSNINEDLIVFNDAPVTGGKDGETDNHYRRRLLNNESVNLSVNQIKREGIIVYSKKNRDDVIRVKMSSLNPYMSNKYALIPSNDEKLYFSEYDLIADDNVKVYRKGWEDV